jgi:hypothetical protein
MHNIKSASLIVAAFITLSCNSNGPTSHADRKPEEFLRNISFVFPPTGYAHDHRQQYIQECLEGIKHDLPMIHLDAFTDTFTIRFVDSREEMKRFTGNPAGGITELWPEKIIYMEVNEKEKGAPVYHEIMHMISQTSWGEPVRSSQWMNEGLAAYSQNSCNGYNDEQIYRYLAVSHMLLPMDAMADHFYQTPEMIAYHQAGCIVEYLLHHYGVEKFKELWQQGFDRFDVIYGVSFSRIEADIQATVERDFPKAPPINWKVFSIGCV